LKTAASKSVAQWVGAWVGWVQRHARAVLIVALIWSAAMAAIVATCLKVDTDSRDLLSADLPWRKADQAIADRFPQLDHSLVAVIDGASPETLEAAQRRLIQLLRAQPAAFADVYAIDTEPYFRSNGLLFLAPDALQQLADQLTQAQPFLGALDHDLSLHGLFTLLSRALAAPPDQGFDLAPVFVQVDRGTGNALNSDPRPLSWQALMGAGGLSGLDGRRRFIELSPRLDFSRLFPAGVPMDAVRAAAGVLHADPALAGVRVRLTGSVAMEHEELHTAFGGATLALGLALAMAAVLLFLALRSVRLVISAVITLAAGLLTTAAFAALTVGHLNLISVAFGVLYVGLGLDYALYLCMQLRERLGEGLLPAEALPQAAADVAGYMLVCALTVSLGFFAFIPTAFTGIGELGIISGAGMFISLSLSLSLLPALIWQLPPDAARIAWQPSAEGRFAAVLRWPYRHARAIWIVTAALAAVSLWLLPHARFDADPLNLRDPKSEALSTFRELEADPSVPTLTLSVLAQDADAAADLQKRLSAVPEVRQVLSLEAFVPTEQAQKLPILQDLVFALGPALSTPSPDGPQPLQPNPGDAAAVAALIDALRAAVAGAGSGEAAHKAEQRLLDHLSAVQALMDQGDTTILPRLRTVLLGSLPAQIDDLKTALQAKAVTAADLPPALVTRWQSADGERRLEIWPRDRLDTPAAMNHFIDAVQRVAPGATGAPVAQVQSARAVVGAFRIAFASALVAITLVLMLLLRSVVDTLLVLVPLLLAGLFTVAGSVLFDVPFNFANVIALPLILGVGVDYGVYLVQRGRDVEAARGGLLRTGTARAVLFGALITMANFGNLMLARHPGMVSMGALLTIGLAMTLLCALVLLPSLLAWRYGGTKKVDDTAI
jgi:hopanoid biosynthesis associated RND transporter like protein HpnN